MWAIFNLKLSGSPNGAIRAIFFVFITSNDVRAHVFINFFSIQRFKISRLSI
jgi:hypothetical protein